MGCIQRVAPLRNRLLPEKDAALVEAPERQLWPTLSFVPLSLMSPERAPNPLSVTVRTIMTSLSAARLASESQQRRMTTCGAGSCN